MEEFSCFAAFLTLCRAKRSRESRTTRTRPISVTARPMETAFTTLITIRALETLGVIRPAIGLQDPSSNRTSPSCSLLLIDSCAGPFSSCLFGIGPGVGPRAEAGHDLPGCVLQYPEHACKRSCLCATFVLRLIIPQCRLQQLHSTKLESCRDQAFPCRRGIVPLHTMEDSRRGALKPPIGMLHPAHITPTDRPIKGVM